MFLTLSRTGIRLGECLGLQWKDIDFEDRFINIQAIMFHGNLDIDTAKGLKALKKRIDKADIPSSKLDESINVATWNIRDFGKKRRRKASIHYIAEILNQFDLVAIVELRRNLQDLRRVMDILGPYWEVVYSDYTQDFGGNWERFAFL
jgi:integrase